MKEESNSQKTVKFTEKTVKKGGVRQAEKHSVNPFLHGETRVQVKSKKRFYGNISEDELVVSKGTGEITGGVEHKVVRLVDGAEFVKVFAAGVAGIYGLKTAGRKVFSYLLEVVQANPNTDRIYLHFMDALEEPWKISKTVFFNGMAELIDKKFVASSDRQNMFFLNPAMVWNGDRFRFVQEYVRKSSEARGDAATREKLESLGQQRLVL